VKAWKYDDCGVVPSLLLSPPLLPLLQGGWVKEVMVSIWKNEWLSLEALLDNWRERSTSFWKGGGGGGGGGQL